MRYALQANKFLLDSPDRFIFTNFFRVQFYPIGFPIPDHGHGHG